MKYIIYQHLPADEILHHYRVEMPSRDSMVIKPQVFPGMYDKPDMHIAHHQIEGVQLITYTEQELTSDEIQRICDLIPPEMLA